MVENVITAEDVREKITRLLPAAMEQSVLNKAGAAFLGDATELKRVSVGKAQSLLEGQEKQLSKIDSTSAPAVEFKSVYMIPVTIEATRSPGFNAYLNNLIVDATAGITSAIDETILSGVNPNTGEQISEDFRSVKSLATEIPSTGNIVDDLIEGMKVTDGDTIIVGDAGFASLAFTKTNDGGLMFPAANRNGFVVPGGRTAIATKSLADLAIMGDFSKVARTVSEVFVTRHDSGNVGDLNLLTSNTILYKIESLVRFAINPGAEFAVITEETEEPEDGPEDGPEESIEE